MSNCDVLLNQEIKYKQLPTKTKPLCEYEPLQVSNKHYVVPIKEIKTLEEMQQLISKVSGKCVLNKQSSNDQSLFIPVNHANEQIIQKHFGQENKIVISKLDDLKNTTFIEVQEIKPKGNSLPFNKTQSQQKMDLRSAKSNDKQLKPTANLRKQNGQSVSPPNHQSHQSHKEESAEHPSKIKDKHRKVKADSNHRSTSNKKKRPSKYDSDSDSDSDSNLDSDSESGSDTVSESEDDSDYSSSDSSSYSDDSEDERISKTMRKRGERPNRDKIEINDDDLDSDEEDTVRLTRRMRYVLRKIKTMEQFLQQLQL